jgi:hypothetical protein
VLNATRNFELRQRREETFEIAGQTTTMYDLLKKEVCPGDRVPGPISLAALVFAIVLLPYGSARAQPNIHGSMPDYQQSPSALCLNAERAAEMRYRLPAGLLFAISRVESGRPSPDTHRLEPWPWAMQTGDGSSYFDSKAEAVRWVQEAIESGVTSIDTGCLQVNLFFHPRAFATVDDAFDPQTNADYAARYLRQLYASTGNWRTATGLYHSQNPVLAVPYESRVEQQLAAAGTMWAMPARSADPLNQLAAAWRETETPSPSQPNGLTSNNWGKLNSIAGRPAERMHPAPGLANLSLLSSLR